MSKVLVDRDRVVESMCRTWRHDFGLDKLEGCDFCSGMTDKEREHLRRQMGKLFDRHLAPALSAVTAERDRLRKAAEPLEPVHGDELPPIGSKVLIHLASCDEWIEHTVAGYYAWGDLDGYEHLHRVFVRVRDSDGYLNARLLKDVRPVGAAMSAKEA